MDAHQIWVSKAGRPALLGAHPAYQLEDLARWSGLKMGRFELPDETTDRHVHGPHAIVSLVTKGRAQARLQYEQQNFSTSYQAGDLICYRAGLELERMHWRSSGAALLSVEIDPHRLTEGTGNAEFTEHPLNGSAHFTDTDLAALMHAMWDEVNAGCPRGRLYTESLSVGLTRHIYNRFGTLRSGALDAGARLSGAQLRGLDEYIHTHIAQAVGIDELAAVVGLSRYHFARTFRNTVGRSPYQHVLQKRVEWAHALLTRSTLPLAEVAVAAGFSSQAHFSDVCRRLLGASPRDIRKQA